jgi:hypothetical protein
MSEDTIAILFARDPLQIQGRGCRGRDRVPTAGSREQYKQSGGKKTTATKVVADLGDLGLL